MYDIIEDKSKKLVSVLNDGKITMQVSYDDDTGEYVIKPENKRYVKYWEAEQAVVDELRFQHCGHLRIALLNIIRGFKNKVLI